jgi:hypothetical protein
MPSLELCVTEVREVTSRLRTLLEKPDAVVLRRNHFEPALHPKEALAGRVRVNAVLAVDVTHPPQPQEGAEQETEEFGEQFAKGAEVWLLAESGPVRVFIDHEEIAGALTLFDAYARVATFQPALARLDQRSVGIGYRFREGLEIAIHGSVIYADLPEDGLAVMSSIVELEDDREARYVLRLENGAIASFEQLLRSAAQWLAQNSYQNVLSA